MYFAVAHPRHWVIWSLLIANVYVFAAAVPKPGLTDTRQLADASKENAPIREVDLSPEIRRQTGALGQPSTPNFAKDHNSQELASYYDIDVSGSEVVLGIKITDDMPVNMRSVQRLLAIATNHYNEEVDRLGKDTILNGNCYYNSWPHLPGINTAITIQDKYFKLLTYGMVSDALRGVVQFYVAHPRQDGELTALIKIPRSVGSRPVELVIVGFVSLLQDDEPPISQNCSLYAARCMPPRESVRTPL